MKSIHHWTYINTKVSKNSKFKIREVAALSSSTRIAYKLNKEIFWSNNAVL